MEKEIVACFSGHRMLKDTKKTSEITKQEVTELIKRDVTVYYSGMALGYDTVASLVVLDLKRTYPHIKLYAALPCPPEAQSKYWSEEEKQVYRDILNQADEVITLSQTFYRGCMQARNRYMIQHSAYCLCYLTEATGGTAYTVKQAKKGGLEIINIANILNETKKD